MSVNASNAMAAFIQSGSKWRKNRHFWAKMCLETLGSSKSLPILKGFNRYLGRSRIVGESQNTFESMMFPTSRVRWDVFSRYRTRVPKTT